MNPFPIAIERPYYTISEISPVYSKSTKSNNKGMIKDALQYGINLLKSARKEIHTTYPELVK